MRSPEGLLRANSQVRILPENLPQKRGLVDGVRAEREHNKAYAKVSAERSAKPESGKQEAINVWNGGTGERHMRFAFESGNAEVNVLGISAKTAAPEMARVWCAR